MRWYDASREEVKPEALETGDDERSFLTVLGASQGVDIEQPEDGYKDDEEKEEGRKRKGGDEEEE